jgi:hypothetical protein
MYSECGCSCGKQEVGLTSSSPRLRQRTKVGCVRTSNRSRCHCLIRRCNVYSREKVLVRPISSTKGAYPLDLHAEARCDTSPGAGCWHCCTIQFLRMHLLARHSLQAKYTTTTFSHNAEILDRYTVVSTGHTAVNRSALIAAKASWHPLGSGCEGNTFAWNQHVIKTFKSKKSPFRNCLPRELAAARNDNQSSAPTGRWPTEIPASLLAGNTRGFLPASDIFFASSSPEQEAQWHLVTPLMEGGKLQTLAKSIL